MANAGIGGGPPGIGVTDEAFSVVQGVNVMQHVYVNRHLVPRMIARGGKIVRFERTSGLFLPVSNHCCRSIANQIWSVSEMVSAFLGGNIVITASAAGLLTQVGSFTCRLRGRISAIEILENYCLWVGVYFGSTYFVLLLISGLYWAYLRPILGLF